METVYQELVIFNDFVKLKKKSNFSFLIASLEKLKLSEFGADYLLILKRLITICYFLFVLHLYND